MGPTWKDACWRTTGEDGAVGPSLCRFTEVFFIEAKGDFRVFLFETSYGCPEVAAHVFPIGGQILRNDFRLGAGVVQKGNGGSVLGGEVQRERAAEYVGEAVAERGTGWGVGFHGEATVAPEGGRRQEDCAQGERNDMPCCRNNGE